MAGEDTSVLPLCLYPKRPNYGAFGHPIALFTNHYQIDVKNTHIHHYEVTIKPDEVPRKELREVIRIMVDCHKTVFRNIHPVFDGKKNLFTKRPLPDVENMIFTVTIPGDHKDCKFTVSLQYTGEINLGLLNRALNPKSGYSVPGECLYALNIIMRYSASLKLIAVGRSFFTPPTQNTSIGNGKEVWFGYHQSVQPCQWKPMLNIDVSATAFHESILVVDYLNKFFGQLNMKSLSESQKVKFGREMKGLKVEVNHSGKSKRRYRICNLADCSRQQTFPLEREGGKTEDCTVEKYFKEKYNKKLRYPFLPVLQVGQVDRQTYLPMEVCKIVKSQRNQRRLNDAQTSNIIKITARKAPDRLQDIKNLMQKNKYNQDIYIKEFDLSISKQMLQLKGRVLPAPQLQYGRGQAPVSPVNGAWDMRGKEFISGIYIHTWAVVCFASAGLCDASDINRFILQLRKMCNDAGMSMHRNPCFCKYVAEPDQVEAVLKHLKASFVNLQFVLVILSGKNKTYAEVKRVGDTLLGLVTQCVQAKNVCRPQIQPISNLCLKINAKLGGVNGVIVPSVRPHILSEPIIIMGADVTHSTSGENKKPSIAALVGSMDAHPSRYCANVRIQPFDENSIVDMAAMTKDLLLKFYCMTRFKPVRIILYRYSAPERIQKLIMTKELMAIREACLSLESEYKPGITYITIQRRHHTRLFCVNKENRVGVSGNVPAGTIVDTGVTHPSEYDFYLCSHAGLQGTSCPCYYHILWDDNKLKSDEVQSLTYQLCHTNARCTRAVSVPTPAYYAHLVNNRARYHMTERECDSDVESVTSPLPSCIEPHENIQRNGMYFV